MKKLMPLALLFFSLSCVSHKPVYADFGQLDHGDSAHAAPQKRDNTIILQTDDSFEKTFRNIVTILTDKGFGMQTIDKELGIITTTSKGIRGSDVALIVQVRDGETTTVHIRGGLDGTTMTTFGVLEDAKYNVEYRGMKGNPLMKAWEEMYSVANAYADGRITYATK